MRISGSLIVAQIARPVPEHSVGIGCSVAGNYNTQFSRKWKFGGMIR
jgi:hypothetical protein